MGELAYLVAGAGMVAVVRVISPCAEGPSTAPESRSESSADNRTWPRLAPATWTVKRQSLAMRMGMRRFTRLTNGFKKLENRTHAVALHFA